MSKKEKELAKRLQVKELWLMYPFIISSGKHKPVTAARRFIAENELSAPSVFNVRRNEHTLIDFFGEKRLI